MDSANTPDLEFLPNDPAYLPNLPDDCPQSACDDWHARLARAARAIGCAYSDPDDYDAADRAITRDLEDARKLASALGGCEAALSAHRRENRLGPVEGCPLCAEDALPSSAPTLWYAECWRLAAPGVHVFCGNEEHTLTFEIAEGRLHYRLTSYDYDLHSKGFVTEAPDGSAVFTETEDRYDNSYASTDWFHRTFDVRSRWVSLPDRPDGGGDPDASHGSDAPKGDDNAA